MDSYRCSSFIKARFLDDTMPGVREASEEKASRWGEIGLLWRSGIWQPVALDTPIKLRWAMIIIFYD